MKVTDEKIQEYCNKMDYKLVRIGKIGFEYIKPNGDRCALLKAAAHSLDHMTIKNGNTTGNLKPGQPCSHPGCCQHITHPCEVCGRTNCLC